MTEDRPDSLERYRRDKRLHGDRVDRPPRWLGPVLLGLLVLLNGGAWTGALPGYGRLMDAWWGRGVVRTATGTGSGPLLRSHRAPGELAVVFLDVGQGDATFLRTPGGRNVLIDTGEGSRPDHRTGRNRNAFRRVVRPFLRRNRIERLDYLILTHPHSDHIGGAARLVGSMPVGEIWESGSDHPSASRRALRRTVARLPDERAPRIRVPRGAGGALKPGTPLDLGPAVRGWLLRTAPRASSANASSLCVLVAYGSTEWLFPADIERPHERSLLLRWGRQLDVDVLKVPHHGSRTSSGESFLRITSPRHTVFSVGRNNPFGHPDTAVLRRVRRTRSSIHRTDRDGSIYMFSDGETIRVHHTRGAAGISGGNAEPTR